MSAPTRMEDALWDAMATRLASRWKTLAERIEPYCRGAAAAYRQAAADIEEEVRGRAETADLLEALCERVTAEVRSNCGFA